MLIVPAVDFNIAKNIKNRYEISPMQRQMSLEQRQFDNGDKMAFDHQRRPYVFEFSIIIRTVYERAKAFDISKFYIVNRTLIDCESMGSLYTFMLLSFCQLLIYAFFNR